MTWCELNLMLVTNMYAAIDKYKIRFVQQIFIFVSNMYPIFKLPGSARPDHLRHKFKVFWLEKSLKKQMTKSVGRGVTCRCNKRT